MKSDLSLMGYIAGITVIFASVCGCAQSKKFSKIETMILDQDLFEDGKSDVISYIENIDYEENHEEFTNSIFESGDLQLLDQLVEYFPDYRNYIIRGDAYLKSARVQRMMGLFMKSSAAETLNEAKESYARALELNNEDIYARGVLGFIYGENGEYEKAEKLFNDGLKIAPKHPMLYLALGQMSDRKKEYNSAIGYYQTILSFTEEEVQTEFDGMNQYYHKLMKYYPDSLEKVKKEAERYCSKDYKRLGIKKDDAGKSAAQALLSYN
ncbi:MAG: hypothetical protein GY941_16485 [Planctomycetes bacterium]|nr:hypothetical protein [Planctomycetota bacterium]